MVVLCGGSAVQRIFGLYHVYGSERGLSGRGGGATARSTEQETGEDGEAWWAKDDLSMKESIIFMAIRKKRVFI